MSSTSQVVVAGRTLILLRSICLAVGMLTCPPSYHISFILRRRLIRVHPIACNLERLGRSVEMPYLFWRILCLTLKERELCF